MPPLKGVFGTLGVIILLCVATVIFLREEMIAYPQKPQVDVEALVHESEIVLPEAVSQDMWEIELATAASSEKIDAKMVALLKKGFPVYIDKVQLNQHDIYQLLVGPFLSKSEAQSVEGSLKKAHYKTRLKRTLI